MNKISLKGRSFLTLKDFTKEEIKKQVEFQEKYFKSGIIM